MGTLHHSVTSFLPMTLLSLTKLHPMLLTLCPGHFGVQPPHLLGKNQAGIRSLTSSDIMVHGNIEDLVESFTYLSSVQASDRCCQPNIACWVGLTSSAMLSLNNIWNNGPFRPVSMFAKHVDSPMRIRDMDIARQRHGIYWITSHKVPAKHPRMVQFCPELRGHLARWSVTCVQPDCEGSECHIWIRREAASWHACTSRYAAPSQPLCRSTRPHFETSTWLSACQVDWPAVSWQQRHSCHNTLASSYWSWLLGSSAMVFTDMH